MTDKAIGYYLDIKVSISVSISIKIYLSNLNIQYLFHPYPACMHQPLLAKQGESQWKGILTIDTSEEYSIKEC